VNCLRGCRLVALAPVLALATGCAAGADTTTPTVPVSPPTVSFSPPTSSPDPTQFGDLITNPWMPLTPGTRWVFTGDNARGSLRTVVTVTDRTTVISGVTTTVVHDVVRQRQKFLSNSDHWYAQDIAGNVWSFARNVRPRIVMPAHPTLLGKTASVPFGHLTGLLETKGRRYYAKGIGLVLVRGSHRRPRAELVRMIPDP
jgi:hypothetical protein